MTSMPLFSREAWKQNAPVYETIRSMPFNSELAAGTLSEARFKRYIIQDAHYLIGFGRALALAAAKAPDPDRIVQFAKSAEGALVVERALHGSFFERYGITPRIFADTPLSPACHHYVSYLLATAHAEPTTCCSGRCCPASGFMPRSGATSWPALLRPTGIRRGSIPMRASSFTPPCAP